ncbi:MAG: DUF2142 domain-containing protein [Chloroflexi bacterium]|nr:DUF2142 domain-containing protein [Chloroflexota bacterium]
MASARARRMVATWVLPIAFLVLATLYSVVVPPWETPDEPGHFRYVEFLRRTASLPVQDGQIPAHQPPLYYALAALAILPADLSDTSGALRPNPRFVWAGNGGTEINAARHTTAETFPFRGHSLALHLARLVSVVLGAATVALVVVTAREIFPEQGHYWLLAGAAAAFNTQFIFLSGAINNDAMAALAGAGAIRATLHAWRGQARGRTWLTIGIWLAACFLAKTTALGILLASTLVLLVSLGSCRTLSQASARCGAFAAPLIVVVGFWFGRNQVLYGEPTGSTIYRSFWTQNLATGPLAVDHLDDIVWTQFRSFWGLFGWMNLPAPGWYYAGLAVAALCATIGVCDLLARPEAHTTGGRGTRAAIAIALLFVAAQEAFVLWLIGECGGSCHQGRYLFPAILAVALLLGSGIGRVLERLNARSRAVSIVFTCTLGVAALAMPFGLIGPAYSGPPEAKSTLLSVDRRPSVRIGEAFELAAYEIEVAPTRDRATIRLFWRARQVPDLDYSAFLHLVDGTGRLVAQRDRAPGVDRDYPPTSWAVGDIVRDERVIELPADFPTGGFHWRLGLYDWRTGVRLPVLDGSRRDFVELIP